MRRLGKKAFIDRFAEALVAIIFTVVLVLLVFTFKGAIQEGKTLEVSDLQNLEIGSVYSSTFTKMNASLLQELQNETSKLDLYYLIASGSSGRTAGNQIYSVLNGDLAAKSDVIAWRLAGTLNQDTFMYIPFKNNLYLISPFTEYFEPVYDPLTGKLIIEDRYPCIRSHDEYCYRYQEVVSQ
jgi:hypothetical protein